MEGKETHKAPASRGLLAPQGVQAKEGKVVLESA